MRIRVTCTAASSTSYTLTSPEGLAIVLGFVVAQNLSLAKGSDYLVLIDSERPPRGFSSSCRSTSGTTIEPLVSGAAINYLTGCSSNSGNRIFTLAVSGAIEPTISFVFTFPQALTYTPWIVNSTYQFQVVGLGFAKLGDKVTPGVWGVYPDNGATDVGVTIQPVITCNKTAIDPTTITSSTVKLLKAADNTAVTVDTRDLDVDGRITLTPHANLSAAAGYYLVVTAGLKDTDGNACTAYTQIATPWMTAA